MGVIILGSQTSPIVIGDEGSVVSGTQITTLPICSPISVVGSGSKADSHWDLSANKITPESVNYKVGLSTVDDGDLADHVLLYDTTTNEIKKIAGTGVASSDHDHEWADITTGKPTTLAGYGITDPVQTADAGLTSISGLSYSSASFVKMTGVDTFTLDTNTYSTSAHAHSGVYEPVLGNPGVNGYVLASDTSGTRSWVVQQSPSPGVTDHGDLTGLSDNDHPQYALSTDTEFTGSFGFSSWKFVLNGTVLDIKYNGTLKGSLTSTGDFSCVGDVTAYSS